MSANKLIVLSALLSLGAMGCATTSAPRGWLPSAREAPMNVYGGWAVINIDSADHQRRVQGEFIAVGTDTLFVLTSGGLQAIPKAIVPSAKISYFDGNYSGLSSWALLGTLSTASHGFYLLLTAPLWILTGVLTVSSATYEQIREYPDQGWNELQKYARFPQGLPASVDRSQLSLK